MTDIPSEAADEEREARVAWSEHRDLNAAELWQRAGELAGNYELVGAAENLRQAVRKVVAARSEHTRVHDMWIAGLVPHGKLAEVEKAVESAEDVMHDAAGRALSIGRTLQDPAP